MIISKCVSVNGIGYSDLSLKLGNGDKIDVIKSMLCYCNETFKKLVNDSQCENPIKIAEGISKGSINLLIQYYGCGKIDINEENVGNMLILCLYYNEKELLLKLINYCLNHISLKIVKCILNNLELFKSEIMLELYMESESFIKDNCIYLFEKSELLEISIDGIEHILSMDYLKLNSENQILSGLLEYYKENKEEIENVKENKSKFEELFKYVNWRKFTIETVPFEELESFNGILQIISTSSHYEINHEYYPLPEISNPKLLKYANKYCFNPTPLLNDDFRSNELEIEDLNEQDVIKIFNFNNIRLIKIMIITIHKYKKKISFEEIIIHKYIYDILLVENKNNEIEKQLTLKSLPFVINDERIVKIYNMYGSRILFELLNISQLSYDIINLILSFIKKINILEEEKIKNEMKEIIKDEKIQRMVLNPLTYFKYPSNHILVDISKNQSIKCEHDGNNCIFSISPDLPDGLKFNKENGEIIIESNYRLSKFECEIKCKQYYIEKSFKLLIENYKFIDNYKSIGMSISENGKRVTYNDGNYNHCYLNVKMESGIYRIKYKTAFTRSCGAGFGVSTINNYNGKRIYEDKNSLSIWIDANSRTSQLFGSNQVTNPNFTYHNGGIYELIYDMDKRIISIKQNQGKEFIIFENIPSPLYPFVFNITTQSSLFGMTNSDSIIEICN